MRNQIYRHDNAGLMMKDFRKKKLFLDQKEMEQELVQEDPFQFKNEVPLNHVDAILFSSEEGIY